MHTYACMHTYIHVHTHTHTHTQKHACMHACTQLVGEMQVVVPGAALSLWPYSLLPT